MHLENTTEEKQDLGIWFDNTLRFITCIGNAVSTANRILELINRSFVYKDEFVMKKLFTELVRPHLGYGNVIWSSNLSVMWIESKEFKEEPLK